jgi:hypothetical protein
MALKSNVLNYLKNITGDKSQNNIKNDNTQNLTEQEQKKMNALFNLDFDDYKKQVKKDRIESDKVDYSKLQFIDNYCIPKQDNTFLIIGIVLIVFSIILMLLF